MIRWVIRHTVLVVELANARNLGEVVLPLNREGDASLSHGLEAFWTAKATVTVVAPETEVMIRHGRVNSKCVTLDVTLAISGKQSMVF